MLRIALCDDEPLMLRELSEHLSRYMCSNGLPPYYLETFSGGDALLESGEDFDLIFLDVRMEPPDGMETARRLRQRGSQSLLVFVTVLRESVFDAFETEPHDYLLKPLDAGRFRRTMDRAVEVLRRRGLQRVVIRRGGASEVISLARIVYCEVQGRKLYIHLDGGEVADCYGRLEEFQRQTGGRLFRCHRSYLVNLDHVRCCRGGEVLLSRGGSIPVSRLRERELTQALLRCMKERRC